MSPEERRAAYAADVTYVTNSELGFDYLRDNLAQQVCLSSFAPLSSCLSVSLSLDHLRDNLAQQVCLSSFAPLSSLLSVSLCRLPPRQPCPTGAACSLAFFVSFSLSTTVAPVGKRRHHFSTLSPCCDHATIL